MNDITKKLYSISIAYIVESNIEDEEGVEKTIEYMSGSPLFSGKVSDEDKRSVRNKIMSERSIKIKIGSLLEGNEKHKKWFVNKKSELDMHYWERYKKYLLQDKGFSINVVNGMDDILDKLTDLLGNPKLDSSFQRRGLIIGDVQSGKTSNYTGLMCKAADAGYEVIVLLTGTIESLRKQTQSRLDEGFVGMDSSAMVKQKENNIIGVGNYNPSIHPLVLTSTTNDFKTNIANNLSIKIGQVNQPILFVVKKNVSTLRNLNKWLKIFNQSNEEKINHSLLVIDDESDNASVNTNPEDRDPTTINGKIRELLDLFSKSSYVGFTATPFANIFIDPETTDKMENEDLFPKDYIYCLNAPSNYIGARDIFDEEGKYRNMIRKIDSEAIELHIPYKHKNTDIINSIPLDLREAIETFLLANVIRDLRGSNNSHRSMLINVSRFTNVQIQIANIVNDYLKSLQNAAKQFCQLESADAINRSKYIKALYYTFNKQYKECEFSWNSVLKHLHKSVASITVTTVNQRNKNSLNYEEYDDGGLRVIAVGGLSLSRGLTLEGLIISYFYRNSKMYDTLMQMGRWFGYRKGYDDLCRIWMSDESISWYEQINTATEELRRDIKLYENSGQTPKDFGIRVRSDINTLLITARNKMRTSSNLEVAISLSGEVIETPCIINDEDCNEKNKICLEMFLKNIVKKYEKVEVKNSFGFRDVDKSYIKDLLSGFTVSILNKGFDGNIINDFIDNYQEDDLDKWDVAFASGTSENKFEICDLIVNNVKRKYVLSNKDKIIKLSGSKKRLGSPGDGAYFLSKDDRELIKQKEQEDSEKEVKSIKQKSYFQYVKRNPLLVIYIVDLNTDDNSEEEIDKTNIKENIVGLSIGIPRLKNSNSKYAKYKVNKILKELIDMGEFEEVNDSWDGE